MDNKRSTVSTAFHLETSFVKGFLKLIGAGMLGLFLLVALNNPDIGGPVILIAFCIALGALFLNAFGLW